MRGVHGTPPATHAPRRVTTPTLPAVRRAARMLICATPSLMHATLGLNTVSSRTLSPCAHAPSPEIGVVRAVPPMTVCRGTAVTDASGTPTCVFALRAVKTRLRSALHAMVLLPSVTPNMPPVHLFLKPASLPWNAH